MLRILAATLMILAVIPSVALGASPAAGIRAASVGRDPADPWEHWNRKVFAFNGGIDRRVIRPLAKDYEHGARGPLRNGIRHFFDNLGEPVTALNDVLQLRPRAAVVSVLRFVTNSTVGLLGILDVAAKTGLPLHQNGFGQTLGRYGVPAGPYLILPVLGPSTVRESFGSVVDGFSDPVALAKYRYNTEVGVGLAVVNGLDIRDRADDQLDALNATAVDPYATLRSVFLQNLQSEISGDASKGALPAFDDPGALQATPEQKTDLKPAVDAQPQGSDSLPPLPVPIMAKPDPASTPQ